MIRIAPGLIASALALLSVPLIVAAVERGVYIDGRHALAWLAVLGLVEAAGHLATRRRRR